MARSAPPPPLLEFTSDDVLIKVFAHVPFFSHGSLRVVCRRAKTLLDSAAFREERHRRVLDAGGPAVAVDRADERPSSLGMFGGDGERAGRRRR